MKYKEVAKNIVLGYFYCIIDNGNYNNEVISETFHIKNDDKLLLKHCKVIIKIMEKAIKEIEGKK